MNANILLDTLPDKTPNGFIIKTDFRQAIKFELLMQDSTLNDQEKVLLALNLFYENVKTEDIGSLIADILWFYLLGKEPKKEKGEGSGKMIYSFEYDADYIYDAFYEQYGIDLNISNMHWWKFRSLFEGLNNNKFVDIMGYRAIDLSKIQDKSERKKYEKLKKIYQLPDMRTAEEKDADFASAFW